MKYETALATILFFVATSAHAATITIGYELPSFSPGTITTVGQIVDPANGTLNVNGFGINTWSSNATGWAPTTTHLVGNVSASVGNPFVMNSFSVYITLSDITAPTHPVTIQSDMTADFASFPLDGWTLNFTTYVNPSNIVFCKQSLSQWRPATILGADEPKLHRILQHSSRHDLQHHAVLWLYRPSSNRPWTRCRSGLARSDLGQWWPARLVATSSEIDLSYVADAPTQE